MNTNDIIIHIFHLIIEKRSIFFYDKNEQCYLVMLNVKKIFLNEYTSNSVKYIFIYGEIVRNAVSSTNY